MAENNESFRNLSLKDKTIVIGSISLLIIFALVVVASSYFFGILGFFKLIGVTYDSTKSLALFIFLIFLLGLLTDFLGGILKLLFSNLGLTKQIVWSIKIGIDSFFSWIVIYTTDELMQSISLSTNAELLLVCLFVLVEVAFSDKQRTKHS